MISANTLFHFTDSLDSLINILVNEFHPRFCLEDFTLVFAQRNPPVPDLELAIPMVCFCDLPMSQLQRHLAAYGNYGIGLKKEWGRRNGITPVLYLHHDSLLVSKFGQLIAQLRDGNLQSQFHKSLSNNILISRVSLNLMKEPFLGMATKKSITGSTMKESGVTYRICPTSFIDEA